MPVLTIDTVTKRYGKFTAVDNVSFEGRPGRILGLLGPNGAGKTSTIRMIANITAADDGEIRFDEKPVGPWVQRHLGYLPEERGLYKKLKVSEQLLYFAQLRGLRRDDATDRIRYWLKRFEMEQWAAKKTQELSKGMQQKIQFISTILPDPDLLILDEPFSGLDPINSELLRDIILEQKEAGHTILFASHRMEQVEQLCDDICLIAEGRILVHGPLRDIKKGFGRDSINMEFEGDGAFLDPFVSGNQIRIINRTHHRVEFRLLNGASARPILEAAVNHTDALYRYELVTPSLSEIFISLVEGQAMHRATLRYE